MVGLRTAPVGHTRTLPFLGFRGSGVWFVPALNAENLQEEGSVGREEVPTFLIFTDFITLDLCDYTERLREKRV